MTRDEVIKALSCCVLRDPDDRPRCGDCPYPTGSACLNRLKADALALLKQKRRCSDCAHQSSGLCARTGCPTRPDVWCDEWEART